MDFQGQQTTTVSNLVLGEDGKWKATITYTQSRTLDLTEWEEKTTTSVAYGTDPSRTLTEASYTMMEYLKSFNYNLFESVTEDVKTDSQ